MREFEGYILGMHYLIFILQKMKLSETENKRLHLLGIKLYQRSQN